ncbi:MAG: hypothetical protein KDN22_25715 [Verrucomicrobiae bacterium]|nr:hypothetical protein [Verrucomicrobiae bacterium]
MLGLTEIDPARVSRPFSSSTDPASIFRIATASSRKINFDLGSFSGESGGTLLGGRYDLSADGAGSESLLRWSGARVDVIGSNAEVLLTGSGLSGFRDSNDNSDAFSAVQRNEGIFRLSDRGFDFSGPFTNVGTFTVNDALTIGGDSPAVVINAAGLFANTGNTNIQSSSTMTTISFNGGLANSGGMTFRFANFTGSPNTLTPSVVGSFSNSGTFAVTADNQTVDYSVSSPLDNTGIVIVDSNAADLRMSAAGGLSRLAGTSLTGGTYRMLAIVTGELASLRVPGADVHGIGAEATVELNGNGASFLNAITQTSALTNLASVEGSLTVRGQDIAFPGGLAVSGALAFGSDAEFGPRVLTINGGLSNTGTVTASASRGFGAPSTSGTISAAGALTQNVGTTLTAGHLAALTNAADGAIGTAQAIIEWPGARIDAIAAGAGVLLEGEGSLIRNRTTLGDALAGLSSNAGDFALTGRKMVLPGNLLNDGPGLIRLDEATLAITGNFVNRGETELRLFQAPVALSASGLDNTGTIRVFGGSFPATVTISGPLAQQVGTTLVGGEYEVVGSDQPARFEYDAADIHTVGAAASISLEGAAASIRNRLTQGDALSGLDSVEGSLLLNDRKNRTTLGNLAVSGFLDMRNADLTITGNFANSGMTYFNFNGFQAHTFTVNGTFSNSGQLALYGGSSLVTSSPLAELAAGVLTAGEIYTFDATVSWGGAAITHIGPEAALGLYGATAAIQNFATRTSALVGLSQNDGYFYVEDHTFSFAGDFLNGGETELGEGAVLGLPPGSTFRSKGRLEVGGPSMLTGGTLQLDPDGSFLAYDYLTGFDPVTFEDTHDLPNLSGPHIVLGGEIELLLYDLAPAAADEFVLFESPNLTGAFSNVAFGGRVPVFNGFETERQIGTFLLSLDAVAGKVTVSGFESLATSPGITITALARGPGGFRIDWNVSDASGADLYRSQNLIFSNPPLATSIMTGTYTDATPPAGKAFYLVRPAGAGP